MYAPRSAGRRIGGRYVSVGKCSVDPSNSARTTSYRTMDESDGRARQRLLRDRRHLLHGGHDGRRGHRRRRDGNGSRRAVPENHRRRLPPRRPGRPRGSPEPAAAGGVSVPPVAAARRHRGGSRPGSAAVSAAAAATAPAPDTRARTARCRGSSGPSAGGAAAAGILGTAGTSDSRRGASRYLREPRSSSIRRRQLVEREVDDEASRRRPGSSPARARGPPCPPAAGAAASRSPRGPGRRSPAGRRGSRGTRRRCRRRRRGSGGGRGPAGGGARGRPGEGWRGLAAAGARSGAAGRRRRHGSGACRSGRWRCCRGCLTRTRLGRWLGGAFCVGAVALASLRRRGSRSLRRRLCSARSRGGGVAVEILKRGRVSIIDIDIGAMATRGTGIVGRMRGARRTVCVLQAEQLLGQVHCTTFKIAERGSYGKHELTIGMQWILIVSMFSAWEAARKVAASAGGLHAAGFVAGASGGW